jgi:hypothetical protein
MQQQYRYAKGVTLRDVTDVSTPVLSESTSEIG